MSDIINDIKSRLDIVDVVSQYVQLKKTGRNFKGLCPFHSEKTPSFVVSTEKQICHCFGCNKGGDIFGFVKEMEGVEFTEAIQLLADRAGIKVGSFSKLFQKKEKSEKDEYFKANDLACEFFQKQLLSTSEGKKVLEYLHGRGVTDQTIEDFKLGFAPDKYDALYPELLKKGIRKEVLIKSGFVSAKNVAADQIFDKYRGRLMFPIFDYLGRICGFGGRALSEGQMPKYLNSADNIVYNKSDVLYGFSHAKQAIKEKNQIILVEGYFDVLLPYQSGIKNIAAVSGTALTSAHVRTIKRLTTNVVTCFDSDKAGFEATRRSYEIMNSEQMIVKTISDLDKKDPADFILAHDGDLFSELVIKAKDFLIFYMGRLTAEHPIGTLDGRRKVMSELLPFYKTMSPSSKDFYIRELSRNFDIDERIVYDEIENFKLPKGHPARESLSVTDNNTGFRADFSEMLMGIVLAYPRLFENFSEFINEDLFEEAKNVYKALRDQYTSSRNREASWNFEEGVLADLKPKLEVLTLYAEDSYERFSDDAVVCEVKKIVDRLEKRHKNASLRELQKEIELAEKLEEKGKLMELLSRQQKLLSK